MKHTCKKISSGIYEYKGLQIENWGNRDGAHWIAKKDGELLKDRQGVNLDRPTRKEIVAWIDRNEEPQEAKGAEPQDVVDKIIDIVGGADPRIDDLLVNASESVLEDLKAKIDQAISEFMDGGKS